MQKMYLLKSFDKPVVAFSFIDGKSECAIHRRFETGLLPPDIEELSEKSLYHWLVHRTIPSDRLFYNELLSNWNINPEYVFYIKAVLDISKGVSMTDSYWVSPKDSEITYSDINPYAGKFDVRISRAALTGQKIENIASIFPVSPEFTLNGMLPKCWRYEKGKVYLYKRGTWGTEPSGYEPYSEYYASKLATCMGINHVDYNITVFENVLCSVCESFTSMDKAYIPISRLPSFRQFGEINTVIKKYKEIDKENGNTIFTDALSDMFVFDAVIANPDRHYGNFGVIVNNRTNKIERPAPLFDFGMSLLAGEQLCAGRKFNNITPAAYKNFMSYASVFATKRHVEMLERAVEFKLPKIPKLSICKMTEKRYKYIQSFIKQRSEMLLQIIKTLQPGEMFENNYKNYLNSVE